METISDVRQKRERTKQKCEFLGDSKRNIKNKDKGKNKILGYSLNTALKYQCDGNMLTHIWVWLTYVGVIQHLHNPHLPEELQEKEYTLLCQMCLQIQAAVSKIIRVLYIFLHFIFLNDCAH